MDCFVIIYKFMLSVENVFECITVSHLIKSKKTVLISRHYRKPDSDIQITINTLENYIPKLK